MGTMCNNKEWIEMSNNIKTYAVTLTGATPLLMHKDDVDWSDEMERWKLRAAQTKGLSKAGDDRTPAWRWIGCLYSDEGVLTIPADNITSCLKEAGAAFLVPGGNSKKTFKEQTQSGMSCAEMGWPILIDGKTVPMAPITKLMDNDNFMHHRTEVADMGFSLFVKRAKIGQSKHVRVRPRFNRWSASGTVLVWDAQLTEAVLRDIFTFAGNRKGLGDWRPSSPKSGQFGRFTVDINAV